MSRIGIGINRQRRTPSPAGYLARAGKGFAFRARDSAFLFQDTAGTVAVTTATNPVGRISPPSAGVFTVAADANRPLWQSNHLAFDGTNDAFTGDATINAILQNAPAYYAMAGVRLASLAAINTILHFSPNANSAGDRFFLRVLTNGAVQFGYRRLDVDTVASHQSAGGIISTGVDYTIDCRINLLPGGDAAAVVRVNGTTVISAAVAGTGNSLDAAGLRSRLGGNVAGTPATLLTGRLYGAICGPLWPTDAELAAHAAWLP